MKHLMKDHMLFIAIQAVIAVEWFHAGIEKYASSGFSEGLPKTLAAFAANNPHAWYKSLLVNTFIPSAAGYAQAVILSEVCVGIGMMSALVALAIPQIPRPITAAIGICSLIVALFLNANFYAAAGWTSPSTAGLNILMFCIEALFIVAWVGWLRERPSR